MNNMHVNNFDIGAVKYSDTISIKRIGESSSYIVKYRDLETGKTCSDTFYSSDLVNQNVKSIVKRSGNTNIAMISHPNHYIVHKNDTRFCNALFYKRSTLATYKELYNLQNMIEIFGVNPAVDKVYELLLKLEMSELRSLYRLFTKSKKSGIIINKKVEGKVAHQFIKMGVLEYVHDRPIYMFKRDYTKEEEIKFKRFESCNFF